MCISCAWAFCLGIASGLADKFRGLVVNTIWEQLHDLFLYDKNIEELENKLVDLHNRGIYIDIQIREGKIKNDDEVVQWFSSVHEIIVQAQNFEREESQANTRCTCTQCPNLCSRTQLSRRAKEMALKVVELHGKQFERIASPEWKPDSTNIKIKEEIDSRVSITNHNVDSKVNMFVNTKIRDIEFH